MVLIVLLPLLINSMYAQAVVNFFILAGAVIMDSVSFSGSTQTCSIEEVTPVNEQTGGAISYINDMTKDPLSRK